MHLSMGGPPRRQRVDRCDGQNSERIRSPATESPDLGGARRGKSRALNRGMAAARGSLYLFVDADDEVGEGYVQRMSEALETYDVVGAFLDTKTLNPRPAQGGMVTNDGIPIYHDFRPGMPGGITGMRAATCKQVGAYDEGLMSAEDVDYTWRAFALGATFGRQLDAVMHVRRPPNNRAAFRKSRSYAHSAVWLYERYRSEGMRRRSLRKFRGSLASNAGRLHSQRRSMAVADRMERRYRLRPGRGVDPAWGVFPLSEAQSSRVSKATSRVTPPSLVSE